MFIKQQHLVVHECCGLREEAVLLSGSFRKLSSVAFARGEKMEEGFCRVGGVCFDFLCAL